MIFPFFKKFPIFWQAESTDCGPACLQMICHFYGKKHSQQFIKDGIDISRIGITVGDILRRSKELGFDSIVTKINLSKLAEIEIPMILHWKSTHFVVLYKVRKTNRGLVFWIADPSNGKIAFSESEFKEGFISDGDNGMAIILYPSAKFHRLQPMKECNVSQVTKDILDYLWKHYGSIACAIALTIISMICSWMLPFLYQTILDKGVISKQPNYIIILLCVQLSFFGGYIFSNVIGSYIFSKLNFNLSIVFVKQLLSKIMRLPLRYFDTHLNGEFIQRLDDFNRLRSFLTDQAIGMLYSILNLILFCSLLCYFSPIAFLCFLLFSIVSILWGFHFIKERKFIDYTLYSTQAKNKNLLYDIMLGMADIKANNAQSYQLSIWERNQSRINRFQFYQLKINYRQNIGRMSLNQLQNIIILGGSCILAASSEISLGTLMSISYVLGNLTGPINQIHDFGNQIQMARISANRLGELQRKENESISNSKMTPTDLVGKIKLCVSFKYPGSFSPWIFKDLKLSIPFGKVTAIVGDSGCGKTTLIKLLLGFYKPQYGNIFVNNIDLHSMDINTWRNLCGTVLQNSHIFSGSIAENISLNSEIDQSKLESSAKLACIYDFINSLPATFNTRIGGAGIELSQGQKQRILIARAVYKNPKILIFDEATSALDTKNERAIVENLNHFYMGRTVIIVAHRLSTVKNADQIIVLNDGKVVESGTHTALIEEKGAYYDLIKNQLELGL
jgi:ATP-binding cassette subfamily B protein